MMMVASLFQTPFFQLTQPEVLVSKLAIPALHPSLPQCHLEQSLFVKMSALVPSLNSPGKLTQLKKPETSSPKLVTPSNSQLLIPSLMMTFQNSWNQLHAQSEVHGSPSPLQQASASNLLISPTQVLFRWLSVAEVKPSALVPSPSHKITMISITAQPLTGTLVNQQTPNNLIALLPLHIAILLSQFTTSQLTPALLMKMPLVVFNKYSASRNIPPTLALTHGPPLLLLTVIPAALSSK